MNRLFRSVRRAWRHEIRSWAAGAAIIADAPETIRPPVPETGANPPAPPAPGQHPARDGCPVPPAPGPPCRGQLDCITLDYTCGCREYYDPDWRSIAVLLCKRDRDWDVRELTG